MYYKNILSLIKNRKTIRKYIKKDVTLDIIKKIVSAGIWSSSIHGFQPWEFLVIVDKNEINKISCILFENIKNCKTGANIFLKTSAETIKKSAFIILVFNNHSFSNFACKIRKNFKKFVVIAELSAISAAIQNMILTAQSYGIGSCWHQSPLLCKEKIEEYFKTNNTLFSILSFGYPAETGKRSIRRNNINKIPFI